MNELKKEKIIEVEKKIDFTNLNEIDNVKDVELSSEDWTYKITTAKGTYNITKPVGGKVHQKVSISMGKFDEYNTLDNKDIKVLEKKIKSIFLKKDIKYLSNMVISLEDISEKYEKEWCVNEKIIKEMIQDRVENIISICSNILKK